MDVRAERRIQRGPGPPWANADADERHSLERELHKATSLALRLWQTCGVDLDKMLTIIDRLVHQGIDVAQRAVAFDCDDRGAHAKIAPL